MPPEKEISLIHKGYFISLKLLGKNKIKTLTFISVVELKMPLFPAPNATQEA